MYTEKERKEIRESAIAEAQDIQKKLRMEQVNKTSSDAVQQWVNDKKENPLAGKDLGIKTS